MDCWKEAGGLNKSLSGTSRAADRFVPTTYLLEAVPSEVAPKYLTGAPQQKFLFQAAMAVLSLMRSVGTPLGFSNEEQPWGLVDRLANRERQHQSRRDVRLCADRGDLLGAAG